MKISSNPKQFEITVNEELLKFLNEDFKDYVAQTEKEMVDKVVYTYVASENAMRVRRGDSGGLSDTDNINVYKSTDKENEVVYVNETQPQGTPFKYQSLAEAVELGEKGWNMNRDETNKGPGPRKFTEATLHRISSASKTYSVFKEYFNKNGIETKKIK